LCGAVRYVLRGTPLGVAYCHCSMCRRAAGAPVTAWALFEAAACQIEKGEPRVYASSPGVERRFCGTCGTPLSFMGPQIPGLIDVTLGSLDDPGLLPPQLHVWESSRLPWLNVADDLPRHPELPDL
jgi:hypothetical protein